MKEIGPDLSREFSKPLAHETVRAIRDGLGTRVRLLLRELSTQE